MVPSEHVRDPMSGRLLDQRYRVGARIARGGMASVYEAQDTRLDRVVAVKIMHPGLGDDDEFAQRFVREARAAARLNHPNVVGVYDQGDDDGTVFLVMEYVPGHTLRDVIRKESPMSANRAIGLLEPVVSALAAAHRAGLIHRDVKPENVLIADEQPHGGSAIKVADFGLAKAVSAGTQHTATSGVLIGTVSYLAPELVIDGRADARADVYAVGVVLYELLTGTKPHEGESPIQVAYRHVHHDVPTPSDVVPGLPDFIDALAARATSRDRTQRPADAGVLLHHLHRVAQALREGATSDPELAADLMPRVIPQAAADEDDADATQIHAIDRFGDDSMALLTEVDPRSSGLFDDGAPDRTTALERHTVALPVQTPPAQEPVRRPPGRPAHSRRAPSRPAPVTTTTRRRSTRGPLLLLLSLLLVAGLGAGAWWFGWARYTTTPGVLGLSQAAATERLNAAGLGAEKGDPEFSESMPKGQVLETDPGPGGKVLDGGVVTLVLSLGPERYDVPTLKGMTADEARVTLTDTKLAFGDTTEKWSEEIPAGQVMSSTPSVGTTLKPGDSVNVVISKGRKPINVKDFTGKSLSSAQTWLDKKGLDGTVSQEQFSDTVDDGDIIAQDPTTGTRYRGDTITFVVSKGPSLVEVPSTRAMGVGAATETLEKLGFVVRTQESDAYIGLGFVYSSDPDAGEMIPKGSTITLFLL